MVGDPAARNRTDPINGKSVIGLYRDYNLYFSEGNNSLEAGIMRVNSYIKRGKLKIFRSCVDLVRELIGYRYPELSMDDDQNLDEKPIKRHDHAPDALRYMLMRLPEDPDDLYTLSHDMPTKYGNYDDEDDYEDEYGGKDYMSYV